MTLSTIRHTPPPFSVTPCVCQMYAIKCQNKSEMLRMLQGTAFSVSERERLELRGLLPKKLLSMEIQVLSPLLDQANGMCDSGKLAYSCQK